MTTLRYLQEAIARQEPSLYSSLAGVVFFVAAPTAVQLGLEPLLHQTLWFAAYFPAVLIAGLMLDPLWGVSVLLLSAAAADYLFAPPRRSFHLTTQAVVGTCVFLASAGVVLATAILLREALRRLNLAARRERELNRELQHRVKNSLAVVQALAQQTARASGDDPQTFYDKFRSRLVALGSAHDVLSSGDWNSCELPDLAHRALEPFLERGDIRILGGRCVLPAAACVPLALALHELATNAVKYGALSAPGGEVSLGWTFLPRGTVCDVVISWVERGGPEVTPPSRRGLGSRLLARQPGLDDVVLSFAPQGVSCTLTVCGVDSEAAGVGAADRAGP
jgi:two-component sensor histidine kinase